MSREESLKIVHKKLLILTGIVIVVIIFTISYFMILSNNHEDTPFIMPTVLMSGILGGFISLQQRLPSIQDEELKLLCESKYAIALSPINGGVFAIVLMLMFIGGIIQGELFPRYVNVDTSSVTRLYEWIKVGFPHESQDIAKLFFWSFVAGFNERFVAQMIHNSTKKVD